MSFSSRVIAEPAPPVSALVRHLGLVIWTLPILLSLFYVLISPRTKATAGVPMVNAYQRETLNAVVAELPDLVEPDTFARIGATPYMRTALNLPVTGEQKFPMKAVAWNASPFHVGGKSIVRASDGPVVAHSLQRGVEQRPAIAADTRHAAHMGKIAFGEPRSFRRIRVNGATSLMADNLTILLAGIEPLPENVMCKRIDGVMQSCNERAEHRLAILLQARAITCELSEPLPSGAYIGRCMADRIDLGMDLVRQKLAQRNALTVAAANN